MIEGVTPYSASQVQVLEADYSAGPVIREEANRFPKIKRGSIRLVLDLYRTESEYQAYIEEGLKVILPGEAGYRPERPTLWSKFLRLFHLSRA